MTALQLWPAPVAPAASNHSDGSRSIDATVHIPGSKSITNRALILAALADGPSTINQALISRDTQLMIDALRQLGTTITVDQTTIHVVPAEQLTGGRIDCGLAGTVMRFVPAVAALAAGTVEFDGDEQARHRPMATTISSLTALGAQFESLPGSAGGSLPFLMRSNGEIQGGQVVIDASASSQFVSGLLLAGARYNEGITVIHDGDALPSQPHVEMTVSMLREVGITVDVSFNKWTVHPGTIKAHNWNVEPDLSNATPFMAAAAATHGIVRIPNWPLQTTQPGDQFRTILEDMGADVDYDVDSNTLIVTGTGALQGITWDMHDIGELTPTVVALAALATTPSNLYGIAHLRGHETDRLAALASNINALGGNVKETADGLLITPVPLHGGEWPSYADHRMATAGAILGLRVPNILVENIETTAKTLPGFREKWLEMLGAQAQGNSAIG